MSDIMRTRLEAELLRIRTELLNAPINAAEVHERNLVVVGIDQSLGKLAAMRQHHDQYRQACGHAG